MIAQKCMRRLWFVEVAGEETRIFYGNGAKTRARLFVANRDTRYKQANLLERASMLIRAQEEAYIGIFGPWQRVGPTLDEYVSPPPSYQPWEVT